MSDIKNVRAKFIVQTVAKQVGAENITALPVVSGSEENRSFAKYTPGGKLELYVTNENLFGFFVPGEEIYLDITKATAQ